MRDTKADPASGIGEEAYSWGWGGAKTALRKGRFTVYVSAAITLEGEQDSPELDDSQKERKADRQKKLSLEFAENAVSKIDQP